MNAVPISARLDLGFVLRGGRTVLDRRVFSWPYVLTRTFLIDQLPAHMLTVIVQSSGGAINEDDQLEQRIRLASGAAVHLTTQGATVVHRARPGTAARERVSLDVAAGGLLEYMPEPRILFPDATFDQQIDVDCDPDATVIIADGFALHDPEGADRRFSRVTSRTHIRMGGDTVLLDRFAVDGACKLRMQAFGSLTVVTRKPCDPVALSASLAGISELYAAASLLPSDAGVIIRFSAGNSRALRTGTLAAWRHLRGHLFGAAPTDRQTGNGVSYPGVA